MLSRSTSMPSATTGIMADFWRGRVTLPTVYWNSSPSFVALPADATDAAASISPRSFRSLPAASPAAARPPRPKPPAGRGHGGGGVHRAEVLQGLARGLAGRCEPAGPEAAGGARGGGGGGGGRLRGVVAGELVLPVAAGPGLGLGHPLLALGPPLHVR